MSRAPWHLTEPRPAILWVLCTYTVLVSAVNYIINDPPPSKERALAYQRLAADPDVFGWALVLLGLTCAVLVAFARTERVAGALLIFGATLWATSFAYSYVFFDAGTGALAPMLTWSMVAAVAYLVTRHVRGRDGAA